MRRASCWPGCRASACWWRPTPSRRAHPARRPPAQPNGNNVNLVANVERLRLDVDRILPLHGRVVPMAELRTAAGRR
jgi:hypothetical protein